MLKCARKAAGLSTEQAAFMVHIGRRTLINYEEGITIAPPEVVLKMAEVYGKPTLTARYCSDICPIGQVYAHRPEQIDIQAVTVKMVRDYNFFGEANKILLEIAYDGEITPDETERFEVALSQALGIEKDIEALKCCASMHGVDIGRLIAQEKTASKGGYKEKSF
jgi:transcriptional regulator with XRE-family HTH domain